MVASFFVAQLAINNGKAINNKIFFMIGFDF